MKIFRAVAALGVAKKLYSESRKPENRERINKAVETVRSRRSKGQRK